LDILNVNSESLDEVGEQFPLTMVCGEVWEVLFFFVLVEESKISCKERRAVLLLLSTEMTLK
jgi:hypothetical protein